MRVEFNAFGNDPAYEFFSANSKHFFQSRLVIPVCLYRGIKVTYEGEHETAECELNFAHVFVHPADQAETSSTYIFASQEREILIGEELKLITSIFAQISIYLPNDEYQKLFDTKPNSIELDMHLEVEGDKIKLTDDGYGLNLVSNLVRFKFSVGGSRPIPRQIFYEIKQIHRKLLSGNLKARYGQLTTAIEQFSESITAGIKKINTNISEDIECCAEILNIARSAFTAEEISLGDKDARVIWRHQNIVGMIQYGDAKKREQIDGFDPKVHEIEELASKLLSLKVARSKALEDCVLDALVFSETIAFARSFYSKKKMLGMRLAEPLKGTEDESLFVSLSKIFGQGLAFYAKEIIFLAITYGVAFMLSAGDVTAAWVITSVFTVYRWYSKGEASKDDPKYKGAVLLNKMIAFYAIVDLNQDRMNLELTKRRLLELEVDGAVYSRYVYEIIERKMLGSMR